MGIINIGVALAAVVCGRYQYTSSYTILSIS